VIISVISYVSCSLVYALHVHCALESLSSVSKSLFIYKFTCNSKKSWCEALFHSPMMP